MDSLFQMAESLMKKGKMKIINIQSDGVRLMLEYK